jgi:hypothetical protein
VVRAVRNGAGSLAELAGLGILDDASLLRSVVGLRERGLLLVGPDGAATR